MSIRAKKLFLSDKEMKRILIKTDPFYGVIVYASDEAEIYKSLRIYDSSVASSSRLRNSSYVIPLSSIEITGLKPDEIGAFICNQMIFKYGTAIHSFLISIHSTISKPVLAHYNSSMQKRISRSYCT